MAMTCGIADDLWHVVVINIHTNTDTRLSKIHLQTTANQQTKYSDTLTHTHTSTCNTFPYNYKFVVRVYFLFVEKLKFYVQDLKVKRKVVSFITEILFYYNGT